MAKSQRGERKKEENNTSISRETLTERQKISRKRERERQREREREKNGGSKNAAY